MLYSLLEFLVCPVCRGPLTLVSPVECAGATAMRTGDERDRRVTIQQGLLVCERCPSWYPIRDGLPEILPAHLRDWNEDRAWLRTQPRVPPGLENVGPAPAAADDGAHYKLAEIAVTKRALPKGFFDWADVAPFSTSNPNFSFDLLARYVTTVSRLNCGVNGVVFDLGCGTGWTTEWLVRLGYQAIGVDLCRDYILAGMRRRGVLMPHYIVGDVENLPLRDGCADATLSFDAFHHVPDRRRAMAEFARIMRPGAVMSLTEPGIEHEHAAVSIDVMRQHGILEKGFDRAGLEGYIAGTDLGDVQHFKSDTHPHDIYTLRKAGTFATDSRAPRAVVARIEPEPAASVAAGKSPQITVTITNTGDTTWLSDVPGETGEVHLGAQLFDPEHRLLKEDYARVKLPRTMRPGDAVRLRCDLPPVLKPGEYLVELDMIDSGYLWFKEYAYQPVSWRVAVTGTATAGDALVGPAPRRITPAELPLVIPEPPAPPPPPPPAPAPSFARRIARGIRRRVRARLQ